VRGFACVVPYAVISDAVTSEWWLQSDREWCPVWRKMPQQRTASAADRVALVHFLEKAAAR
jgi:hypothetical protein